MGNDTSQQEQKTILKLRQQLEQKNQRLNELKKQNQKLVQQQVIQSAQNKQITVDSFINMNYSTFTCINCRNFYDEKQRLPIMACKNQHNVCQLCQKILTEQKQQKCLECLENFKNLGKNRSVINLIANKGDLANLIKQRDVEILQKMKAQHNQSSSVQRMTFHLCKFANYQTFFQMNNDSLLKTGRQDLWFAIRSTQELPPFGESQISFKIIYSVHNSIILGITTQKLQFQKGSIPKFSLAFHLNNGHIYDQLQGSLKWRTGGTPVSKNSNPSLCMNCNFEEKKIKWKINNKVYAQASIPKIFLQSPVYIYIAMYHKGDMIVLNK